MFMGRVLRVMVCSPSDVSAERAEIVKVIHQWTADSLVDEDVVLVPVLWEDMLPSTVEGVDGQTSINEMMTHKADIFIGVFKHRFGVEARAGAEVGTVEEIMIAMKAKKPLHLFFYSGPDTINQNNAGEVAQLAKVHEFKSSMRKHGIYAPYEKEHELKEMVLRALHADTKTFIRANPLPTPVAPLPTPRIPREFPTAADKPTDAPPVSGSEVVYSTSTDAPTDKSTSKTPSVGRTTRGLPTRPPAKTAKGIPTRPKPLPLDYGGKSRSDQRTLDLQEKGKKFVEGRSHMTISELQEFNEQEKQRKSRRDIDESGNWDSMQAGDALPDLEVLGHPAPKVGYASDDELEAERRKQEWESTESIARWNADLPLKKVDDQTHRLSAELPRHKSWKVEARRGQQGDFLGASLTLAGSEHAANVQLFITDPDGVKIPFKQSIRRGDDDRIIRISVAIPKNVRADRLLIRVAWDLEDLEQDGHPQEEHHTLFTGGTDESIVETKENILSPVLSLMHSELRVRFEGESKYLVDNLNISIRDIMGEKFDFGFRPGELGGFQAGQTLSFPLDLSKTGSMHNTVDISWTVNGQEFSTSQQMVLI